MVAMSDFQLYDGILLWTNNIWLCWSPVAFLLPTHRLTPVLADDMDTLAILYGYFSCGGGGTTHVVESPAVCIVCQISRIVLITRKRSTCVCDRDQNWNQMWSQGQSVSSGNILLKDSGARHDTEWIHAGNDLSCIKKCREHQEMFEQGESLSNFGGNRGSSPMLGLHAMYGNVLTLLLFAGSLLSTEGMMSIHKF